MKFVDDDDDDGCGLSTYWLKAHLMEMNLS